MLKLSFFKTPKPRQFEYRPRYYDPEKEAREERRRELLGDRADDKHGYRHDDKHDDGLGDVPGNSSGDGPGGEYKYKPGQYIRRDMAYRRGLGTRKEQLQRKRTGPMRLFIVLLLLGVALWWIFS